MNWTNLLFLQIIWNQCLLRWHPPHDTVPSGIEWTCRTFHRCHKASFLCYAIKCWFEILPIILFGLCSSIKEDFQASVAELVFGETLHLPGEFFSASKVYVDPATFVGRLKDHISTIHPFPTSLRTCHSIFVHNALSSCSHVFLWQNVTCSSLQPLYAEPFWVLSLSGKSSPSN